MTKQEYLDYLYIFNENKWLIITFSNGLVIKCNSFLGVAESDTEEGDEDYIGEYFTGVDQIEIVKEGNDSSIEIYENSLEINIHNIADKIELEDGTLLWENPYTKK